MLSGLRDYYQEENRLCEVRYRSAQPVKRLPLLQRRALMRYDVGKPRLNVGPELQAPELQSCRASTSQASGTKLVLRDQAVNDVLRHRSRFFQEAIHISMCKC